MKNTALIIIDVQKDYFPGGKLELHEPEKAAENARKLLEKFRDSGLPIYHIKHEMPPELGFDFLVKGTDGSEIHPLVAPRENENVVIKELPDSFHQTDLNERLQKKGIEILIICGMMTHICVSTTARSAMHHGYQVIIPSDATATLSMEFAGETIPAETVQKVNIASLNGLIATVKNTVHCLKDIEAGLAVTPV